MSKIALATALVALTVALPTGHAGAQSPASFHPPPGAAPPWANQTTTTEAAPASAPTATSSALPAAQSPGTGAQGATPPAPIATTVQPSGAGSTTPISATPMQGTTTPIHVVSLRAGPGTNSPVIGTLHPGDQLEILATANYGWTQVRSPAGTGWAYGSYLAPKTSASAPASDTSLQPE